MAVSKKACVLYVVDIRGEPIQGANVSVSISKPCFWVSEGVAVAGVVASGTTDENGGFYCNLVPLDVLYPSDAYYEVVVKMGDSVIADGKFEVKQSDLSNPNILNIGKVVYHIEI
jgi:hypothetical protein